MVQQPTTPCTGPRSWPPMTRRSAATCTPRCICCSGPCGSGRWWHVPASRPTRSSADTRGSTTSVSFSRHLPLVGRVRAASRGRSSRWRRDIARGRPRIADPRLRILTTGSALRLDPDLVQSLDLETYRRDAYRQALGEVDHLDGEDPLEYRMREICYLHLTRFVQVLLDRKDRMSMAHGLEVRVPFCGHRLVEYVYNVPWAMKTFDGRSLARAAVADLLPESVLARRKSPYPSTQDPAYPQALTARLAQVLADPATPVLDLLDRQTVAQLIRPEPPEQAFGMRRMATEFVLGLDQWLRRYPVRLDLAA
jgi:hypothetical protein